MMCLMDRDWARLGSALRAAREDLGLGQKEVADRIGVSRNALRNTEIGEISRVTPTVREYARIVGWTEASIDVVLNGGEPTREAAVPPDEPATAIVDTPEDLPLRIRPRSPTAAPSSTRQSSTFPARTARTLRRRWSSS